MRAPARSTSPALKAASNTLSVYRLGSTKGERGAAVLAYVVEVTNRKNIRDMVFVDANTGKFVNRYSMVADALERHVHRGRRQSDDPVDVRGGLGEGDPFPGTLERRQQDLVSGTGESYWLFKNTFGRDSYDGQGAPMITVNNDGRHQLPQRQLERRDHQLLRRGDRPTTSSPTSGATPTPSTPPA